MTASLCGDDGDGACGAADNASRSHFLSTTVCEASLCEDSVLSPAIHTNPDSVRLFLARF